MTRPYSYHVAEQLSREASMSVDTAAVEDSIAGRYLSSAARGEVERAEALAKKIRTSSDTQAVVEVLKEQRGSNIDILVGLVAQAGSYLVGRAIGSVSPHAAITAVPAVIGTIASFALPAHYAVRAGIASATVSYVAGAAASKKGDG